MNLSKYSEKRFKESLGLWQVDAEYSNPMFNYLIYGFSPGSFFDAVLANDFMSAMSRSHPANTIPALKKLVGWIRDCMPREAYGSYYNVEEWCKLNEQERRAILERNGLIYTAKQETFLEIKGDPVYE